jgi:hypothetical protein
MTVTLDKFKTQIGIPLTDLSEDDKLNQMLAQVIALAERESRRKFTSESVTEYYDGNNSSKIVLRIRPVATVTEVRLDNAGGYGRIADTFGDDTILGTDEYALTPTGSLERLRGKWWPARQSNPIGLVANTERPGQGNVQVTYQGGFAEMPLDIEGAIMKLIASVRDDAPKGKAIASESLDYYSISFQNVSSGGQNGGYGSLAIDEPLRVFRSYRTPFIG